MEAQKMSILDNGEKTEVEEVVLSISTEEEFLELLTFIKALPNLSEFETALLNTCQSVISANVEDIISLEFEHLIALGIMAVKYPDHSPKIVACLDYLNSVCDFEGELCPDFYLAAAQTFGALMPSN